jgi:hypothetical protein
MNPLILNEARESEAIFLNQAGTTGSLASSHFNFSSAFLTIRDPFYQWKRTSNKNEEELKGKVVRKILRNEIDGPGNTKEAERVFQLPEIKPEKEPCKFVNTALSMNNKKDPVLQHRSVLWRVSLMNPLPNIRGAQDLKSNQCKCQMLPE